MRSLSMLGWVCCLWATCGAAGCAPNARDAEPNNAQAGVGGGAMCPAPTACNCPTCGTGGSGGACAPDGVGGTAGIGASGGEGGSAGTAGSGGASMTSDGGLDLGSIIDLIGGGGASSSVRADADPVLCPSPFTCQDLMGFPVCKNGSEALPPACTTNADCTAAGLPDVPCVDLSSAVGFPIVACLKLCNAP